MNALEGQTSGRLTKGLERKGHGKETDERDRQTYEGMDRDRAVALAVTTGAYLVLAPAGGPAVHARFRARRWTQATIERGAYLARLGDCGACHTAEGGKPMAGGLAFVDAYGRCLLDQHHA